MDKETINLVSKIVEKYLKYGAAKALNLSRIAIVDHERCHILHRLHAMLLIKNDPSDFDQALKHSNWAKRLYPRSLEYRYFGILLCCNNRKHPPNVIDDSLAIWTYENTMEIANPTEPCWDLYKQIIDEEAARVESGEAAVSYVKMCFMKLINMCYRRIDSLPFSDEYIAEIFTSASSHQMFKEKFASMKVLINTEYSSCSFMERMFSEVCFQYALTVKEENEMDYKLKDTLLVLALASAKVAYRVFPMSKDYFINMCVRTLQCNKNLSIIDIQNMKDELRVIRSSSSHEPYCKFLSIEEDVTYPEIFGKYYNNCIDLLLHFIQTLESMDDDYFEDEEFISMYHKRLKTNDLLEFSMKSIFYKRDIEYLLQNIPNLKGKQITTSDLMKMVMEIVEIDNKKGSLEASKLTQLAIDVNQPPPPAIFLRLHSKYIFENDHNDIQLALKFAKCAVSACPNSLDHIFFNASLQYQETSMASSNNKIKYWMILFACEKSLMLESVAEADEFTAKIIQLVDKKTNEFKSKMEIILYLKNKLRNLINMCYRSIDDLPTSFLDNITSKTIPPSEKMKLTIEMFENPKYRFCPFLYRVYSELCHTFALQSFDAKDEFGSHWLKSAYISATIADRNFHSSIEYGINHITRNLQVLKNFYIGQAAIISQDLQSIFNNKNYQEPYYKYLISDNEYKDDKQRNGYFVSCATLLEVYAVTLEQEFKDNRNEFNRTDVFYKELKDIGLTDFPKKAPGFFANIRYLLENPPTIRERYHGLLDDEENEDHQPSKEKKDDKNKVKMRKKKNKNASRKK